MSIHIIKGVGIFRTDKPKPKKKSSAKKRLAGDVKRVRRAASAVARDAAAVARSRPKKKTAKKKTAKKTAKKKSTRKLKPGTPAMRAHMRSLAKKANAARKKKSRKG